MIPQQKSVAQRLYRSSVPASRVMSIGIPRVPGSHHHRQHQLAMKRDASAPNEEHQHQRQQRQQLRPQKNNLPSSQSSTATEFTPGTPIVVEVMSFGPMGASVNVIALGHDSEQLPPADEPPIAKGLILQKEIHLFRLSRNNVDVQRGEILNAYVERIRDMPTATSQSNNNSDDNTAAVVPSIPKLDVCLRGYGGTAKAEEASARILQRLRELGDDGASLPIGDKSPHEEIGRYFPGVSKTAFKRAIGNLFDQKLVWPSPYSIRLYTEADHTAAKQKRFEK